MTDIITPYEVGQLLSEAQEKINYTLSPGNDLAPEDYQELAKWRDDVENIFTALVDEMLSLIHISEPTRPY